MHRTLLTLTIAALGLGCVAGPTAAAAAPTFEIHPASLERGANVRIAHLEGKTIVEGSTRVRVDAAHVTLLAESGADYLVGTTNADFGSPRVWRVTPSGRRTRILSGYEASSAEVSDSGARLAASRIVGRRTTVIEIDTASGAVLGERTFRGYPSVLDVDGPRVAVGTWTNPRSFIWNTASNRTRTLAERAGGFADLSSDQFAFYTRDPYNGGCTVLTHIARPSDRIWRDCDERVEAMNPAGTRMATVHILSDGIGPNRVVVRRNTGARLATYTTDGYFGAIQFEDRYRLLLDTTGKKYAATARCDLSGCERASKLRKADFLR